MRTIACVFSLMIGLSLALMSCAPQASAPPAAPVAQPTTAPPAAPTAAPAPKATDAPKPAPTTVAASSGDLLILAASDLQYALPEIAKLYEQQTGNKVIISLGSTGNFASQIENGASADLFFAADQSFIQGLSEKALVVDDTRQIYATGRIVVVAAKHVTVEVKSLEDLLRPELKKVAIANPEHAPYGRAARSALQSKQIWDKIEIKLVLGENISQTFQLVQTGNADAGIVALSIALGVPGTNYTLVDDKLHPALNQEAAVLKSSKQPDRAKAFLAFLNGPNGRPIMKKYGFVLPGEGT